MIGCDWCNHNRPGHWIEVNPSGEQHHHYVGLCTHKDGEKGLCMVFSPKEAENGTE